MPLVAGSEPSVVYLIWSTPAPPSLAESVTETGELVCQPVQAEPLHWIELAGAVVSATTVNGVALESRPAAFVAVTSWLPEGTPAAE